MKRIGVYLLLFISIFVFGIFQVKAADDLSIKEVSVSDKSATITLDDLVVENNVIKSKIRFNQQDDFVSYKIVIKNDDTSAYELLGAKTNNENVVAEVDKTTVNSQSETAVIVKLTYKNPSDAELILDDFELELNLVRSDDREIIVNPPTNGNSLLLYLTIILMIVAAVVLLTNHKKASTMILILALMLVPAIVYSKEEVTLKLLFEDVEIAGVEEEGIYTTNFYPDEVTIGEAMPSGITIFTKPSEAMASWEQTTAGSSRPFYLRHFLENNIVTESYIEFIISKEMENTYPGMKAGKYKMRGDEVGAYYEDNKAVLLQAFGEQNCEVSTDQKYTECEIKPDRKIYAATSGEYGMVHFQNDNYDCFIYDDNTSSCGEVY